MTWNPLDKTTDPTRYHFGQTGIADVIEREGSLEWTGNVASEMYRALERHLQTPDIGRHEAMRRALNEICPPTTDVPAAPFASKLDLTGPDSQALIRAHHLLTGRTDLFEARIYYSVRSGTGPLAPTASSYENATDALKILVKRELAGRV